MKSALVVFNLVLALIGCAASHPDLKAVVMDQDAFAGMWHLYQHCRAGADLELLRIDALGLGRLAMAMQDPPPSLPKPFDQFVSRPPLRLAADPKALAADCALHAGQVASDGGRPDLAAELFLLVLQRRPEAEYTYYVDQARVGLAQLVVSGMGHAPQPIPISSPR